MIQTNEYITQNIPGENIRYLIISVKEPITLCDIIYSNGDGFRPFNPLILKKDGISIQLPIYLTTGRHVFEFTGETYTGEEIMLIGKNMFGVQDVDMAAYVDTPKQITQVIDNRTFDANSLEYGLNVIGKEFVLIPFVNSKSSDNYIVFKAWCYNTNGEELPVEIGEKLTNGFYAKTIEDDAVLEWLVIDKPDPITVIEKGITPINMVDKYIQFPQPFINNDYLFIKASCYNEKGEELSISIKEKNNDGFVVSSYPMPGVLEWAVIGMRYNINYEDGIEPVNKEWKEIKFKYIRPVNNDYIIIKAWCYNNEGAEIPIEIKDKTKESFKVRAQSEGILEWIVIG